jgi:hypothetical protein
MRESGNVNVTPPTSPYPNGREERYKYIGHH